MCTNSCPNEEGTAETDSLTGCNGRGATARTVFLTPDSLPVINAFNQQHCSPLAGAPLLPFTTYHGLHSAETPVQKKSRAQTQTCPIQFSYLQSKFFTLAFSRRKVCQTGCKTNGRNSRLQTRLGRSLIPTRSPSLQLFPPPIPLSSA